MKKTYTVLVYENSYSGVLKRKTTVTTEGTDSEDCAMKAILAMRKLAKGSEYPVLKRS